MSQNGLALLFKDYQAEIMQLLWSKDYTKDDPLSSRDVYLSINETMPRSRYNRDAISRASVINFLNRMVDEGVLDYTEKTGKGGHRRLYSPAMTEPQLWAYVSSLTETKLNDARQR